MYCPSKNTQIRPMRCITLICFTFLLQSTVFGQMVDSCLLVGSFTLDRLEMSQQLDSNSRTIPSMRWSLYEHSVADTLTIKDDFGFVRSLNFQSYFNQISTGQFKVKQDSLFTLAITKGQLYTMPILNIETLNRGELVIVERFKTRWMRRTFHKNL